MTRDELYDLILGVAVVTVAYMAYKQHKGTAAPAPAAPTTTAPTSGDWREDWLSSLIQGAY